MAAKKKIPSIRKPTLDKVQDFAKTGGKKSNKERVFYAPQGDKRLTINLREDLHKKLRLAALEKGTTAGDIIEGLLDKHL